MPLAGRQAPAFYRYKIGRFELTAVSDGVWNRPIDDKFIRNAFFPDVQKVMSDAFLPAHILPTPFTAVVVNTGKKLVLIDTGTGGQITSTLTSRRRLSRRRLLFSWNRPQGFATLAA